LGPGAREASAVAKQHSTRGGVVATDRDAARILEKSEGPPVSVSPGLQNRTWRLLRENVRRFAAGEKLLGVVDPQVGY